jgi:hypothetical protein
MDNWQAIVSFMADPAAQNWIALGAVLVALLSFVIALRSFQVQKSRDRRIELQQNYLQLELESNSVFRFEAEQSEVLAAYTTLTRPANYTPDMRKELIADQFYLQQLNLFEIAARFRRSGALDAAIFGSWVMWFYEVTRSWWFRERWIAEYSNNYTFELNNIFTPMVAYISSFIDKANDPSASELHGDEVRMRRDFFEHVAALFDCDVVVQWLSRPRDLKPLRRSNSRST